MQWVRQLPAISGHSSARGPICLLILYFHDFKEVSATTELTTVSQRAQPCKRQLEPRTYGTSAMEWVLPTMGM